MKKTQKKIKDLSERIDSLNISFTKFLNSPIDEKLLNEMTYFVEKINNLQKKGENLNSTLTKEICSIKDSKHEIVDEIKTSLEERLVNLENQILRFNSLSMKQSKMIQKLSIKIDKVAKLADARSICWCKFIPR